MARLRTIGGLGGLMDSDSEPDFGGIDDMEVGRKRKTVVKKAPANRVVKPSQKLVGHGERRTMPQSTSPRRALADRSNLKASRPSKSTKKELRLSDGHVSSDQFSDTAAYKPRKNKPTTMEAREQKARTKSASVEKEDRQPSYGRQIQNKVVRDEIPETQMSDNMAMVDVDEEQSEASEAEQPAVRAPSISKSSETDAENASLKRRLREMTERYEGLQERHRELREVGVKAAERNYDKLRKQADESSNTASQLIAELKKELESQRKAARSTEDLRQQLTESETNGQTLLAKVSNLTQSLTDAEREITTLTTKLTASRAAEASLKAPGSALKGNAARSWTGQSELVHAAHAKEDLYGDLTGLLVQSVKKEGSEEVFDCIQTGRNGTLHFKLALGPPEDRSERYEDMLFTYLPQLQHDRDADLMELLPPYLLDSIAFSRSQASKFYSRVVKSLTERASNERSHSMRPE